MDLSPANVSKKFIGVWQSSDQAGKQVVRGSFIIFFQRFLIKIFYFVRTVILARLLFPDDFGLFGLATLVMAIPDTLSQHGMATAIIQRKEQSREENKSYLDVVWTVNLIRNIILASFLYFIAAPFGAEFFHNPNVIPLARAMAIIYIFVSLENNGVIMLQKELKFNRQFFYIMSGVIIEVLVCIISALILKNAWALLIGAIANRATYAIVSYFIYPHWPRLNFDWPKIKELFNFGKWIGVGGIITFLVSQGDNLTIGRMLDTSSLGFYQLAFSLATLPAVEIARSLNNVLFPLYARIQNDRKLLNMTFIKISRLVFALIIPASLGLVVLGKEIIFFLYGERWVSMAVILYVVVAYAFFKAFDYMINPLFTGIGKPKITTIVSFVQALVMFSLIVPLIYKFGAVGAAMATTAGIFVAETILFIKLRKEINLNFLAVIKIIIVPIIGGLIMSGLILFIKKFIPVSNLFIFISYIIFGILSYAAAMFLLDKISGRRFYESFLWIKKNA